MKRTLWEGPMIALLNLIALIVVTFLAAIAAVSMHWLFLRVTFALMRPATAGRVRTVRTELVRGTAELAHAFGPHRSSREDASSY
jgi:hypothetical protein